MPFSSGKVMFGHGKNNPTLTDMQWLHKGGNNKAKSEMILTFN